MYNFSQKLIQIAMVGIKKNYHRCSSHNATYVASENEQEQKEKDVKTNKDEDSTEHAENENLLIRDGRANKHISKGQRDTSQWKIKKNAQARLNGDK